MFSSWARSPQATQSFTLDDNFIRLAVIHLWAEVSTPAKFSNTDAAAFSSIIQQLFQGMTPSVEFLINTCNDLILRTRIYDVLATIASISAGKYEVLSKMLLGLCADVDFLAAARAEMSGDMDALVPKLLIGQQAEVMRELLGRAMANAHSQPSDEASSTR
jgi:hypothetical protein